MKADAEVVAIVQQQEAELRFQSFGFNTALLPSEFLLAQTILMSAPHRWDVGCEIRRVFAARCDIMSGYVDASIAISISLFSGAVLFQCAVGHDVTPDNWGWIAGKTATCRRFGSSSLLVGRRAAAKGRGGMERLLKLAPEPEFAAHGGAFPIRLTNLDQPIGAIVVSGLTQDLDHQLIVDVLRAYLEREETSTVV